MASESYKAQQDQNEQAAIDHLSFSKFSPKSDCTMEISQPTCPDSISFDPGSNKLQNTALQPGGLGVSSQGPLFNSISKLFENQTNHTLDTLGNTPTISSVASSPCNSTALKETTLSVYKTREFEVKSFSASYSGKGDYSPTFLRNSTNMTNQISYGEPPTSSLARPKNEINVDKFSDLKIQENVGDMEIKKSAGTYGNHWNLSLPNETEDENGSNVLNDVAKSTLQVEVSKSYQPASGNAVNDGETGESEGFNFQKTSVGVKLKTEVQSEFLSSELTIRRRSIDDIMAEYGIHYDKSCKKSSDFTSGKGDTKELSPGVKVIMPGNMLKSDEGRESLDRKTHPDVKSDTPFVNTNPIGISRTSSVSMMSSALSTYSPFNSSQNNDSESRKDSTQKQTTKSAEGEGDSSNSSANMRMPFSTISSDRAKSYHFTSTFGSKPSESYKGSHGSNLKNSYDSRYENSLKNAAQNGGSDKSFTGGGGNYEMIKSLGSKSEAIGYSINQERQRLRKLDNMITTTPTYVAPNPKGILQKYMAQSNISYTSSSGEMTGKTLASSHLTPTRETFSHKAWDHPTLKDGPSFKESKTSSTFRQEDPSVIRQIGSPVDAKSYILTNGNNSKTTKSSYDPDMVKQLLDEEKKAKERRWKQFESKTTKTNKEQKNKGAPKAGTNPLQRSQTSSSVTRHQQAKTKNPKVQSSVTSRKSKSTTVTNKAKLRDPSAHAPSNAQPNRSFSDEKMNGFDFVKALNRIWSQSVLGDKIDLKNMKSKTSKYQHYEPMEQTDRKSNYGQSTSPEQYSKALFPRDEFEISPQRTRSAWAVECPTSSSRKNDRQINYSLDRVASGSFLGDHRERPDYGPRTSKSTTKSAQMQRSAQPKLTRPSSGSALKSILKNATPTNKVGKPRPSSSYASSKSKSSLLKKHRP